jgi:hypothetical protein
MLAVLERTIEQLRSNFASFFALLLLRWAVFAIVSMSVLVKCVRVCEYVCVCGCGIRWTFAL